MLPKKELRKQRIKDKISQTTELIDSISEKLPSEFEEFVNLGLAKDGIYKRIETSIQNILDICFMINSDLRLGAPENENSLIKNLEKNKILSSKILKIIDEMKSFRNILVHKYGEINDEKSYNNIKQGLDDFELIFKEVEEFLKKSK